MYRGWEGRGEGGQVGVGQQGHSEAWPCGQGAAFERLLIWRQGSLLPAGKAPGVLCSWGPGFLKAIAGVLGRV